MTDQGTDTAVHTYRTKALDRFLHSFDFSPFYEEANRPVEGDSITLQNPEGWRESRTGPWRMVQRPSLYPSLPHQGWKIHLSSVPGDAIDLLHAAAAICYANGVSFKHLSSWTNYYRANMKYAPRSSSGKFVTVYPDNEQSFQDLLIQFDEGLRRFHGPYILSDVKFGSAPVFFRYGAFYLTRLQTSDDRQRYGIYTPSGQLVEDERLPVFKLPSFVVVPAALESIVASRLHPDPERLRSILFPYTVVRSLHFSNAGGVYEAKNSETGARVVLKEARHWAGFSSSRSSSLDRLTSEHRALQLLQSHPFVPRLHGLIAVDEHTFLVEEYIDGVSLQSWIATNYPFSLKSEDVREYESSALRICRKIEEIVHAVHDAGLAILDLQPRNLIIGRDEKVTLIDLECAADIRGQNDDLPGTPGFVPELQCGNRSRDLYALCNVIMYTLWPSSVAAFSADTLPRRLLKIRETYSDGVAEYASSVIARSDPSSFASRRPFHQPSPPLLDDPSLVRRIVDGIGRSRAMISSHSRLYPGDANQFAAPAGGGINLETGALGVALVLHRAGSDVTEDVLWLTHALDACPDMPTHGLLRGRLGLVSGLCEMGFEEEAARTADTLELDSVRHTDLSVRSGIAGSVIAVLSAELERPNLLRPSLIERLIADLDGAFGPDLPAQISSPYSETGNAIGLFDGWSGVALACRAIQTYTNDSIWGDRAHRCIDRDVKNLITNENGEKHVHMSSVSYSYLSEGSAGIAYAMQQVDACLFVDEVAQIVDGLELGISLNPGLFRGLAGISATLSSLTGRSGRFDLIAERQLKLLLDCYSFQHTDSDALFFLGDNTYRLSTDYSTGAAGILAVVLSRAMRQDLWLPYSTELQPKHPSVIERG